MKNPSQKSAVSPGPLQEWQNEETMLRQTDAVLGRATRRDDIEVYLRITFYSVV